MLIQNINIQIINETLDSFFKENKDVSPGDLFITLDGENLSVCTKDRATDQECAKVPDHLITNYLKTK